MIHYRHEIAMSQEKYIESVHALFSDEEITFLIAASARLIRTALDSSMDKQTLEATQDIGANILGRLIIALPTEVQESTLKLIKNTYNIELQVKRSIRPDAENVINQEIH